MLDLLDPVFGLKLVSIFTKYFPLGKVQGRETSFAETQYLYLLKYSQDQRIKRNTHLTQKVLFTHKRCGMVETRKGKASEAAVQLTFIVVVDIGDIKTTEHRTLREDEFLS